MPANRYPHQPCRQPSNQSSPAGAGQSSDYGLVYEPLDSWIYPAFERLFSLGYADSAYLDMRPWTRNSCLQILQETYPKLQDAPQDEEAWSIFRALAVEFGANAGRADAAR